MKQSISLNAARAFIEAHFDEPVTLAQLAALSALSVSRFATVFRQQYGSSPYRYLCGLRIHMKGLVAIEGRSMIRKSGNRLSEKIMLKQ